MTKKKIVLYITSMRRGGAERVMSILANSFAKEGHDVILATDIQVKNNKENYRIDSAVKCIHIDPKSRNYLLKNLQRIKQLRRIVKDEDADVTLSFLGRQNYRMLMATLGLRCRKCVSVRNDPNKEYGESWMKKWIANRLFALSDICVFQTEDVREYFNKRICKKSVIIPNPIDKKFFKTKRSRNPKNIITVGRLESQKNHRFLIDVFTAIADHVGNEKLLIYGDGSLKDELENQINKLGMHGKIILMGEREDIEKEMARAKMFVLSSDYEGTPNALLEALAIGLPCASTDCPCGGPRNALVGREDSALVPCGDSRELGNAILWILNNKKMNSDRRTEKKEMEKYRLHEVVNEWKNALFSNDGVTHLSAGKG